MENLTLLDEPITVLKSVILIFSDDMASGSSITFPDFDESEKRLRELNVYAVSINLGAFLHISLSFTSPARSKKASESCD